MVADIWNDIGIRGGERAVALRQLCGGLEGGGGFS